jgi:hypothetical protein
MLQALDLTTSCLKFPSSLGFPRAPTTLLNLQNVCNNTFHKICNKIQKNCNPFQEICNKIQKVVTHFRRFANTIQKVARIGENHKTKQNKPKLHSN